NARVHGGDDGLQFPRLAAELRHLLDHRPGVFVDRRGAVFLPRFLAGGAAAVLHGAGGLRLVSDHLRFHDRSDAAQGAAHLRAGADAERGHPSGAAVARRRRGAFAAAARARAPLRRRARARAAEQRDVFRPARNLDQQFSRGVPLRLRRRGGFSADHRRRAAPLSIGSRPLAPARDVRRRAAGISPAGAGGAGDERLFDRDSLQSRARADDLFSDCGGLRAAQVQPLRSRQRAARGAEPYRSFDSARGPLCRDCVRGRARARRLRAESAGGDFFLGARRRAVQSAAALARRRGRSIHFSPGVRSGRAAGGNQPLPAHLESRGGAGAAIIYRAKDAAEPLLVADGSMPVDSGAAPIENLAQVWRGAVFRAVTRAEAASDPRYQENRAAVLEAFRRWTAELLLPLVYEREVRGALALGAKRSGGEYSAEDFRLLAHLSEQLALSLENGRLYEASIEAYRRVETSNRKLIEMDRVKKDFVANICHELRTPVSTIIGYSEILREWDVSGRQREMLDRMINNGQELSGLMD